MNVIWLDSAQKQLEEIIVYISGDSSKSIAEKYVADLF
jgi:plasmid stabilization system protein ParE